MKQFSLLVLAQLMVHIGSAQLSFSSLQDVLSYADKNSLISHQGAGKQKINRHAEGMVRSGLLPRINLYGTADYYPIIASQVVPDKFFGGTGNHYQKVQFGLPYNFAGGIEMNMPLINFEKWEQLKAAKLQTVTANLNTKTNLEILHISLTQFYYQALLYKVLIQLNDENEKVMAEFMRIIEERKKNNTLNPADYNRSQNLSLQITNTGIDYRKLYQLTVTALKAALDFPDEDSLILTESIKNSSDIDSILPNSSGPLNRAALKETEALVEEARQAVVTSAASSLPKLSLYGKYAYQLQMKSGNEKQHLGFDVSTIGVRLDIPLFSGNYYKLQKRKNEEQLLLAQMQQQQVKRSLQKQEADWQTGYYAAVQKQQQLKRQLDFSSDNLRIAQLSLKEGVLEYEEFNTIFREHIRIQIESMQNTADGIVYKLLRTITNKQP